jgi:Rps23 Pro-64 3,4-dihydroxylase Tpa1-like proline 4-hydroxylase
MLNRDLIGSTRLPGLHREFVTAQPFPHIVIDGLFDSVHLDAILREFDGVDRADWISYDNANEVKFGTRPNAQLGPAAQAYFDTIHRGQFVSFLSALTGIPGLVPDPMLRGGGLHEIPVGGQFKVHTDFTRHTDTLLDNRLVVITYLNKEWQPSYGGALELWTKDACVREVLPLFGRTIIFSQSAESLHGHPRPVATPDGRTRRSVAAYFYTNGRPDASPPERVGTKFLFPAQETARQRLARAARYIVPPILIDGVKMARRLTSQTP